MNENFDLSRLREFLEETFSGNKSGKTRKEIISDYIIAKFISLSSLKEELAYIFWINNFMLAVSTCLVIVEFVIKQTHNLLYLKLSIIFLVGFYVILIGFNLVFISNNLSNDSLENSKIHKYIKEFIILNFDSNKLYPIETKNNSLQKIKRKITRVYKYITIVSSIGIINLIVSFSFSLNNLSLKVTIFIGFSIILAMLPPAFQFYQMVIENPINKFLSYEFNGINKGISERIYKLNNLTLTIPSKNGYKEENVSIVDLKFENDDINLVKKKWDNEDLDSANSILDEYSKSLTLLNECAFYLEQYTESKNDSLQLNSKNVSDIENILKFCRENQDDINQFRSLFSAIKNYANILDTINQNSYFHNTKNNRELADMEINFFKDNREKFSKIILNINNLINEAKKFIEDKSKSEILYKVDKEINRQKAEKL